MSVALMKNIEFTRALRLTELLDYRAGEVISRTLAQQPQVNITLFALDQGEGISTHTTAGDALVQVLDGEAEITVGGQTLTVKSGEAVVMPQGVPHALTAVKRFKMLLTVVKKAVSGAP